MGKQAAEAPVAAPEFSLTDILEFALEMSNDDVDAAKDDNEMTSDDWAKVRRFRLAIVKELNDRGINTYVVGDRYEV